MTETDYVALLKEGDEQGLLLCYNKYYTPLSYYLHSRKVSSPDAEELIHDAFFTLWNLRSTIQNSNHIRILLFQNLKWAVRDLNSRNITKNKVINSQVEVEDIEKNEATGLLHSLDAREFFDLVSAAINSLPAHQSRIIWLRAEGFAGEEIARILGIKHSTVRTTLHEARKHLGRIIPEHWFLV